MSKPKADIRDAVCIATVSEARPEHISLPKLYTVLDVADLLKVSIKTVRRWIDDEELIVHRFSRQIRVSEADLAKFIRARRRT